jgi:AGCS family alanine or glycine:cation symporter
VNYAFNHAFGIDMRITAGIVVLLLGLIIFGGVKRIASVHEWITPFMAIAYAIVALIIIFLHFNQIPAIFTFIIKSALGYEQVFAGIFGSVIAMGVKRGVYSNEAGQGSAVHAAAAADVSHPAKQGLVQAFSVYVDTLLVCSATAFIILATGMYNVFGADGSVIYEGGNLPAHITEHGPIYTQLGVDAHFPGFGAPFVAIILSLFAFTTLISYYFQAESNVYFLFKKEGKIQYWALNILRTLFLLIMFFTSIQGMDLAWDIADIGVALMAWTNIIAIILLQKPALKTFRDYARQRKQGIKEPVFDAEKLNIPDADEWKINK